MQQRSARKPAPTRARAFRASLAVATAAMFVAVPFAGRSAANGIDTPRTQGVSTGSVAAALAPALPRHVHALVDRARADSTADVRADSSTDALPRSLSPRQRLALGAPGTYIGDLLRVRDSAVVRWPDRVARPLTVWIASAGDLPDWHDAYLARVADAFGVWTRTGVPVHFRFVRDSSAAEVHVGWIDRFHEPISGRTVWTRDDHWWMTDASITLALHHSDGNPLDEDQVRAIALHEVGHLLGLDHTSDPTSVMAPRVRVRELSAADQATARLIYALPAGRM